MSAQSDGRASQGGGIFDGPVELDNHADTHVLGRNCLVLFSSGRTCSVSPFSDKYKAMKDVPIVTAATAYDDEESGRTIILILHEAIWLGDQMEHTLLNPNQCRSYGLLVCDDPTDPHRELGFVDPVTNISVPFKMKGSVAMFLTCTPTIDEIDSCDKVIMCSEP
jgi:hypothetical protein